MVRHLEASPTIRWCGRIGTIGACLLAAACSSGSPTDSASQAANTGDAGPSRLGDAGLDAGVDTDASAPGPSGTPCVDAGGDAGASPPVAPADGRCALTPTMLVAASSIATPVDAGPVLVGFGSIAATPSGLLYATYVVQNNPPDLANEYLAGALLRVPLAGGQPTDVASGHLFVKPVVSGSVAILGERGGIPPGDDNDSIAALPFDGGPPTTIFNFP
ncbi:MAG: hypothetical protein ACLP1X_29200, partial [Polyangiaceae bacterium]